MTSWIKVTARFDRAPEDWAVICDVFERHGIPGTVQTDDPPAMGGYLVDGERASEAVACLRRDLETRGALAVTEEVVPDEDWAESWKQFFEPRRIGQRLVVRPTWKDYPAAPDDKVIVLDPGQAFGTGDHPTTRLCLELMESIWEQTPPRFVADIGCGSGILSVAAKLLGSERVIAVDIDDVAIESARENAIRNGVCYEVAGGKGFSPFRVDVVFDAVLSNIISAALIHIAPSAACHIRSGGHWIVSGVIEANWTDVEAATKQAGFEPERVMQEGDWIAAVLRRRDPHA
ncbi:MAG TPA: 50S ribosomal protein L11 methyltransferase [Fimbriimonadaceae bacterium]|nr:50S ribosomal protein L11 methyltransferase [Fimbriimonadaceae bacterium]HRJ96995.1 50S ribosomal protein L11 methyltransferase [Fimbriimonadaceae bacterium]